MNTKEQGDIALAKQKLERRKSNKEMQEGIKQLAKDFESTNSFVHIFKEEQEKQHRKISEDGIIMKEDLNHIKKKLEEIYPKVKEDIEISDAIKTLNKYGQGRVKNWSFWLQFIVLLGAVIGAITVIKMFFTEFINFFRIR